MVPILLQPATHHGPPRRRQMPPRTTTTPPTRHLVLPRLRLPIRARQANRRRPPLPSHTSHKRTTQASTMTLPINATPAQIRAWRSSRAWRALSTQVVQEEPVCWLRLPGICTVRSTTTDHVIPVATRPDLAMLRRNCHGACKPCNDWRRDLPITEVRALAAAAQQQGRTLGPQPHTTTTARRRMARQRKSLAAQHFFTTHTTPRPTT